MSDPKIAADTMRTVRFHSYGEPADVLRMDREVIPSPAPGRIRILVHACGLNPADWALCRGLFAGDLPRGIGLEVSGLVKAVGVDVTDVSVGDRVLGTADYAGCTSAGASDYAIMNHWRVSRRGSTSSTRPRCRWRSRRRFAASIIWAWRPATRSWSMEREQRSGLQPFRSR